MLRKFATPQLLHRAGFPLESQQSYLPRPNGANLYDLPALLDAFQRTYGPIENMFPDFNWEMLEEDADTIAAEIEDQRVLVKQVHARFAANPQDHVAASLYLTCKTELKRLEDRQRHPPTSG